MRQWDIFCKVIDNFGDIGVCWRLARDLAQRGQAVRLWLDDASALAWMAPEGTWPAGVSVLRWPACDPDSEAPTKAGEGSTASAPAHRHWPEPGDVVVEAFGCDLPDGFVARMQRPAPPVWINLEYLSAEDYVERSHRLPSPVFSGPGTGLRKWFFYPGFTERTGGLLREPGLLAARDAFQSDPGQRQDFLVGLGVEYQPGDRVVTLFCYPQSPVHALLNALAAMPGRTRMLLTPGAATDEGLRWSPPSVDDDLTLHALPLLPQPQFDRLLWSSDLNLVRGEDSAVRALWAARPHLWQLYRQNDGVHADKLEAFAARWMADWPASLREAVRRVGAAWNQLPGSRIEDLSLVNALLAPRQATAQAVDPAETRNPDWAAANAASSVKLANQTDLTTQLLYFVTAAG
jgi:uncharacterized repeat protein (TIGR03837 family)